MKDTVSEKLKLIDNEILSALGTISELEEKLSTVRTDEDGKILKDDCIVLKDKFTIFNKSLDELTDMLVDLGIINRDEVEGK